MTTTGQGEQGTRTGSYTDQKNNMTSPSWANLLHKYIAESFFKKTVSDGDAATTGTIKYVKTYNLGFNQGCVTYSNVSVTSVAGTLVGKQYNLIIENAYLEFDIVGDSLKLYYSSTGSSAAYELFVDDVSQGQFSTAGTVSYKQSRVHSFPFGEHRIKIKRVGTANQVRLEGLEVAKEFIFKNAGNIGRSSDDWQPGQVNGLYDHALSAYDRHVIIMLGTNDRTIDGWNEANSIDTTLKLLTNIVRQVKIDIPDMQIYIACANDVNGDEADKAFRMRDVRDAIAMVAISEGLPFIDNYKVTVKENKATILADGLHPNDSGHLIMANNFISEML
jgi:lysophospholipase L1-like esterase